MSDRPNLNKDLDEKTFRNYYYLKEELVDFCKQNNLPLSGGKPELTERIAYFLGTGKVLPTTKRQPHGNMHGDLSENTIIEPDIVYSENLRAFFNEKIGKGFSFNVAFQNWLKSNPGKTLGDAVDAYFIIAKSKKTKKPKSENNSNTTLISVISSATIPENPLTTQSHAGNTKKVCPDITDMNAATLLHLTKTFDTL